MVNADNLYCINFIVHMYDEHVDDISLHMLIQDDISLHTHIYMYIYNIPITVSQV